MFQVNKMFWGGLVTACVLTAGADARAAVIDEDKCEIYYGDFNNDGNANDIYFHAKDTFVLIHGDIAVPIYVNGTDGFAYYANGDGQAHALDLPEDTLSTFSPLQLGTHYFYSDANNDGHLDIVVTLASGDQTITVAGGAVAGLPMVNTNSLAPENIVAPNLPQLATPGTSAAELQDSDQVMTVAGSFRVNESGAATYTMPIKTAEGTAGVAPQMSVTYSSAGGGGLMGPGWSLSGLSSIARCRQTLHQDGRALPISWGPSDRFCYQGQRLLVVSGTYGAPGSKYRTEIDSYSEITAVGGTDGNPDYFEVRAKDGSISRYGDVGNSDSEAKGYDENGNVQNDRVLSWLVNVFQDSAANQIVYDYDASASHHRIDEVRYAFGASSANHNAYLKFIYNTQSNKSISYSGGVKIVDDSLLTSIESYNKHQNSFVQLRKYNFDYNSPPIEFQGAINRLADVEECVPSYCLPKTVFDWASGVTLFTSTSSGPTLDTLDSTATFIQQGFADISGDGEQQVLAMYGKSGSCYISHTRKNEMKIILNFGSCNLGSAPYDERFNFRVLDYNLDGRSDVLVRMDNVWRLAVSKPQTDREWNLGEIAIATPFSVNDDPNLLDFEGNGLVDAIVHNDSNVVVHPLVANPIPSNQAYPYRFDSSKSKTYNIDRAGLPLVTSDFDESWTLVSLDTLNSPVDFNGDGLLDTVRLGFYVSNISVPRSLSLRYTYKYKMFAFVQKDGEFVYYGEAPVGTSSLMQFELDYTGVYDQEYFNEQVYTEEDYFIGSAYYNANFNQYTDNRIRSESSNRYFDINGDGLTDVFSRFKFSLSNGAGFAPSTNHSIGYKKHLQFVDINRDGYSDIVFKNNDDKYMRRLWNPTTNDFAVEKPYGTRISDDASDTITAIDVDGDGWADPVYYDVSELKFEKRITNVAGTLPANIMTKITNGLGAETHITYENLVESDAYTNLIGLNQTTQTVGNGHCEYIDANGEPGVFACPPYEVEVTDLAMLNEHIQNPLWWLPEGAQAINSRAYAPIFEAPVPYLVVTNVKSSSPSDVDINSLAEVAYKYHHLRIQAGGRGMLGFEQLSTVDKQTGVVTTTKYRQDWPFTGQPQSTEVRSKHGHLLKESRNELVIKNYASLDAEINAIDENGTVPLGPVQVYVASAKETVYDLAGNGVNQGSAISTVETLSEYDSFGNVERMEVSNYVGGDTSSANLYAITITASTYGPDDNAKFLGRLLNSEVINHRPGATIPSVTRKSVFTYYGINGSCSGNTSNYGLLCEETLQVGDPNFVDKLTTTHYYDEFGNKIFTATVDHESNEKRLSAYHQYDATGRYVDVVYGVFNNELSSTASTPDSAYTIIATEIGASVHKVSEVPASGRNHYGSVTINRSFIQPSIFVESATAYTAFGNAYFTANAAGGYSTTLSSINVTNCPAGSKVRTIKISADGAESASCVDKMGRSLRNMTKGFDGTWIYKDTEYDVLGRATRTSEPYYAGETVYWTVSDQYDILGRLTSMTHPFFKTDVNGAETANLAVSSVSYNGLSTTKINGKGQSKTETKNILGEVIAVTEKEGTNNIQATYQYDVFGQLEVMTDSAGNATTITYNDMGQKVSMDDPNKGFWTYQYNNLGDLLCQRDAKGQVIKNAYDAFGRLIERKDYAAGNCTAPSDLKAHAEWTYDIAANGLGQLSDEQDIISGYSKIYDYDYLGRAHKTTTVIPGESANDVSFHHTKVTFDELGRAAQNFDAARDDDNFNRGATQNEYNQYGYLSAVLNADQDAPVGKREYYRITSMDARGKVTAADLAEGVTQTTANYNARSGLIERLKTVNALGAVQDMDMRWDHVGNLAYRNDLGLNADGSARDLVERFQYDNLNRLTQFNVHDQVANDTDYRSVTYKTDGTSNIHSKSGVGTYSYNTNRPHAVATAGGVTYSYDANGNMVSDTSGRVLGYGVFDKVTSISKGGKTTEFEYGTGRNRYKRVDTDSAGDKVVTLYLGSVEKVYHHDNTVKWKRNLAGVAQITMDFVNGALQSETTHYLHKDHLGSINLITNADGSIKEVMAFDPWGARRETTDWEAMALSTISSSYFVSAKPITTRGFTGHEMVDEMGIIHMNGRIYDAKLGRFLQADPFIQEPTMMGSLNRYSYVMNNPLNATDPSGYNWISDRWHAVKDVAKVAAVAYLSILTYGAATQWGMALYGATCASVCSVATAKVIGTIVAGAASGFVGSASAAAFAGANSADAFRAGLQGAASGALFSAIGAGSGGWTAGQKVLAHGMAGGVLSVLRGGKFGHGFVSTGFTKYASLSWISKVGGSNIPSILSRTTIASFVGGTVSQATGGKFANGARTAFFSHLFNQEGKNLASAVAQKVKNSCSGVLWCGLNDKKYSGHGSRVEVPGRIYGTNQEKIGFFSCACRVEDPDGEFGDRLVSKATFFAPGEKRSDNNLYGVEEKLIFGNTAWDTSNKWFAEQYTVPFQVDTNSFYDRIYYREFLKAYENNYQSAIEVRRAYEK